MCGVANQHAVYIYTFLLRAKEHIKPNLDAKVTKSPVNEEGANFFPSRIKGDQAVVWRTLEHSQVIIYLSGKIVVKCLLVKIDQRLGFFEFTSWN